jgi:hypothetical protein
MIAIGKRVCRGSSTLCRGSGRVALTFFLDEVVEVFAGVGGGADVAEPGGKAVVPVVAVVASVEDVERHGKGDAFIVIGGTIDNIVSIGEGIPDGDGEAAFEFAT